LEKSLCKISNNSEVVIPSGYSQKGRHTHSTIRIYPPKGGFIAAHCGNYFQQEFPDFYKHLGSQIEVKNQLSYFVTIQKPEKGGELTLFDLLWEEGQTKVDPNEDNELILPGNQKLDITQNGSLKRRKIEPDAGDLLLFSGGRIWHRIEPIIGQIPRITLGGFLAYSEPTNKLFYWS
jgi:hypothetical protein